MMLRTMFQRCLCDDPSRRPVKTTSECNDCCCYCCLQCCNQGNNYAHIEYDDSDEQEVMSNSISRVPVEKIFKIPQQWKTFITQPHHNTAPYSWQEMQLLSTSEDSVVREQPKAVPYDHTKGNHYQSTPQQRLTFGSSSDGFTPAATVTESATKKARHLPLRLKSEELSLQSKVLQLPVRSGSLEPEGLSSKSKVSQLPVLVEEGDDQSYPSLQFSLHYDIQRHTMTVHLQEAFNLPAKDQSGTSDPFVVMHLHPNKEEIFESKIVYKTLNPFFYQSFEFHNLQLDDLYRQSLVFRIYDHDRFSKDDMIGGIVLPLKDVDVYGVVYRMRVDESVEKFTHTPQGSKGDLLLSLKYKPEQCVLEGMILKVTNLEKQDVSGLADPYVKVYLVYQGMQVSKWKSSVKKNTLVATFNEPFQFDLENKDINNVELEVVVMDYDRFSRNDLIGRVLLGANAHQHSGYSHWTDMVATPWQRISRWHSIEPALHHIGTMKRKSWRQKSNKSATM